MSASPFQATAQILAEPVFGSDVLRIIAKDAAGLKKDEREAIVRGAEELEIAYRTNAAFWHQLAEAQQQIAAMKDRLFVVNALGTRAATFRPVKASGTGRFGDWVA